MTCTPQTNASLDEIAQVLAGSDDIVICGHVSPDGDCIGSQLALAHELEREGKRVACVLVSNEPYDPTLAFLPGAEGLVYAGAYRGACRTFVGVDVPNRERIGDAACRLLDGAETSITIDHHASKTTMARYVHVDPDAASTTMLVWEVVKRLAAQAAGKAEATPDLVDSISAECALCGLMTDTGGFRYQNADVRAFNAAGEMVARGAVPSDIAREVFQNRSIASLKLEALAIERMQFVADGAAVMSWVGIDDLLACDATKADAEPLINTLRCARGTEVACMLRDQRGTVKGSLRAKGAVAVDAIAEEFGGGGHRAAAGFTVNEPLHTAWRKVQSAIERALESEREEAGETA